MGGDEIALKWLVANYGPQVVTIWVMNGFTSYKSGVYYEANCPTTDRNHAIVSSSGGKRFKILIHVFIGHRWLWN